MSDHFQPPPLAAKLRVQATLLCHDKDGNVIGTIPIDQTETIELKTEEEPSNGADD